MVETAINWLLQQDAAIAGTLQGRVTPYIRDNDDNYPAATYQKQGFEQETLMDGSVSNICQHMIDLDVWTESYLQAKDLSEKIKNYFINFSGNANGNTILLIKLEDIAESVETDPERYLITLKFTFYTDEA